MEQKQFDVVIVGAGPAGIFTALELSEKKPGTHVLIVDSGQEIDKRVCPMRTTGKCMGCTPCAIMCGWSGAGAFSDGKLSLSDEVGGQLSDYIGHEEATRLIHYADSVYCRFGAPDTVHGLNDKKVEEIAYEASRHNIRLVACPVRHMGTEHAFGVLRAMYIHLMQQPGIEFWPRATAGEVLVKDGKVCGVRITRQGQGEVEVCAPAIVAAPGRGGAAWLTGEAHRLGIELTNNEVDIGVRVEVPNSIMDHL
nr:FAD-dependent oxidoreductase [bacterium]